MNSGEALNKISKGEGQYTEFKESFSTTDEAIKSLCAFTHAKGGTVFFGVKDNTQIVGVTVKEGTLENFSLKVRQNSQPPLCPTIDKFNIQGKCVIAATIDRAIENNVHFVFGVAYIRSGKVNLVMTPDEIKRRLFINHKAENPMPPIASNSSRKINQSWEERENERAQIYKRNNGLFLTHTWQPSNKPDQVADIIISLWWHEDRTLPRGKTIKKSIKSVDYHLGPKFFNKTVVKTNPKNDFRLEVSAYGPFLCLARVNFDDGTPSVDLERYVDFWPSGK